ncbi:helix-turn-helix transcriptional regulator [soil metagenome]
MDAAFLNELIAHLYDAALDDQLWRGMATRIADAFESSSTVLKLHSDDRRVDLLETTGNLVMSSRDQAWADDRHRKDLWVERSVAFGLSRIITDEQLVTREEQENSAFYQEWLPHLGIHHMLGAVFPAADGAIGVLGIHRSRAEGPYGESDRRDAGVLLPHLQRALQMGQRLAGAALTRCEASQALDRLDAGVLVVDRSGRIIHASAVAEAMLRGQTALGVSGGRLFLRDPALHDRLLGLVRGAIETARGQIAPAASALAVPRELRLPLTLAVTPLRPSAVGFGDQRPRAMIFLRDPEAPMAIHRLRDLFGFTRAEAAIAGDLGRGRALEDIAARRGIGLATVRSHLKRILAKTGTNRQAEVAALLARSVATLPGQG